MYGFSTIGSVGQSGDWTGALASLATKTAVIGVSYELARMETIRPQPWDIPMDWVVTERGAHRRAQGGLVLEENKT